MMNIRNEAADGDFLRAAIASSEHSLDPSTKVGGVLLLMSGDVVGACNTFLTLEGEAIEQASREERYDDVLHAEEVLLLDTMGGLRGAWYYGSHEPCGRCWKLLARAGVERVVFMNTSEDRRQRWNCDSPGAEKAKQEIIARGHPSAIKKVMVA